jgi:hypothetical protein
VNERAHRFLFDLIFSFIFIYELIIAAVDWNVLCTRGKFIWGHSTSPILRYCADRYKHVHLFLSISGDYRCRIFSKIFISVSSADQSLGFSYVFACLFVCLFVCLFNFGYSQTSPPKLFQTLVLSYNEYQRAEFLGKALMLDIFGINETCADKLFEAGEHSRAIELYLSSNVDPKKFSKRVRAIGKEEIAMRHFADKLSRPEQLTKQKRNEFALLLCECVLSILASNEPGSGLWEESRASLCDAMDMNWDLGMESLFARLILVNETKLLLRVAYVTKQMKLALEMLGESGLCDDLDENVPDLIAWGHSKTVINSGGSDVFQSLGADARVVLLINSPTDFWNHTQELQILLGLLTIPSISSLIDFLTREGAGDSWKHPKYRAGNDIVISALLQIVHHESVKDSLLAIEKQNTLEAMLTSRWGFYNVQSVLARCVHWSNHRAMSCICWCAQDWKNALEHSLIAMENNFTTDGSISTHTDATIGIVEKHICETDSPLSLLILQDMVLMVLGFWAIHQLDIFRLEQTFLRYLSRLQHTLAQILLKSATENTNPKHCKHNSGINRSWKHPSAGFEIVDKLSGAFLHAIATQYVLDTSQLETPQRKRLTIFVPLSYLALILSFIN